MDFCCQIVATRDSDIPQTLISCGFQNFGHYSHSMQTNAFSLIFVSPVRPRDSDSTDYLYSPCSTASVYHFFISVIKRLFCCGLRGLFPWNYYITSLGFHQVNAITCGEISLVQQYMIGNAFAEISVDKKENRDIWSSMAILLITVT